MLIAVFLSCRACKPNFVCRSFFPLGRRVPHTHSRCSNVWDASPARTKSGTTVIPLGRALLCGSSDLPGSCDAPSRHVRSSHRPILANRTTGNAPPLFGLAPCGVYPATAIADGAVRSYRTFSPLPRPTEIGRGGMFSVALAVNGSLRAAARTLSGTPLCGVRTFLYQLAPAATVRPSS